MKRLLVAVALLAALAACGSDDDTPDERVTTTTGGATPVQTTSTTAAATTTTLKAFGNTAVSSPDTSPPALLTDVQVGAHDGFERIVFRFGKFDTVPGYTVAHASGPFTQDGSGQPVAVAGSGHIAVRLNAAAHSEAGQTTYTGSKRIQGHGSVTEVVMLGDFEGVVSWVIGTTNEKPFRVFTLEDPARVVVDVQSP